jgi:hypothetical protein
VKIYVAAVEAPRKKKRGAEDRMNSISPSSSANVSDVLLKRKIAQHWFILPINDQLVSTFECIIKFSK